MKTIITSSEDKISSKFDKRFGRAAWFCLFDEDTQEISFHKNHNQASNNGAGRKAAETMVELHVEKVISGDFGPKAKDLLDKFNIQLVIMRDEDITIEHIIEKLKNH